MKFKILFMLPLVAVLISGCGLTGASGTLDDKVSRLEASYNSTLRVLIAGREPCVDNDTKNDDLCLINDDTYRSIDKWQNKAQFALDKAQHYAKSKDDGEARGWIEEFEKVFVKLKNAASALREAF